jgi:acetyl-CoA carboxylase alpha subunit
MAARLLGQALRDSLAELEAIPGDDLRRRRRARFRSLGVYA